MIKTQENKVVLWDFDGTLGGSEKSGYWSGALMYVLDTNLPGHNILRDDIRMHLRSGFPWHEPDRPHPELMTLNAWWAVIEGLFARAYERCGIPSPQAAELATLAHARYVDPSGFALYDDAIPVLESLSERGWQHIILSNHVPELPDIISALGLDHLVSKCISSGNIAYEKPHPKAFRLALEVAGHPKQVWMVGDSLEADVKGAEAVGIPAILVRRGHNAEVTRSAPDLFGAAEIISGR